MISINPGSGVRDVSSVWINPGSGVREVTAVWTNVNDTLYQVWPVAHTAYDGSTFKGALNGGLTSGFAMYCSLNAGSGYVGNPSSKTVYNNANYNGNSTGNGTANANITSGTAVVSIDYTSDSSLEAYAGWRSKNLINISLYDSITVASTLASGSDRGSFSGICLMNSAGTSATFISADSNGTCDVSSYSGQYYVLFVFRFYFTGTSTTSRKYCYKNISSISFA